MLPPTFFLSFLFKFPKGQNKRIRERGGECVLSDQRKKSAQRYSLPALIFVQKKLDNQMIRKKVDLNKK